MKIIDPTYVALSVALSNSVEARRNRGKPENFNGGFLKQPQAHSTFSWFLNNQNDDSPHQRPLFGNVGRISRHRFGPEVVDHKTNTYKDEDLKKDEDQDQEKDQRPGFGILSNNRFGPEALQAYDELNKAKNVPEKVVLKTGLGNRNPDLRPFERPGMFGSIPFPGNDFFDNPRFNGFEMFQPTNPACNDPAKKTGFGRAAKHAWSYTNGKCEFFIFGGGIPESRNNFESERECIDACIGPEADLPPAVVMKSALTSSACNETPGDTGLCRGMAWMWTYDPTVGCKMFSYGGCGGNNNKFYSESECQQACSGNSSDVADENVCEQRLSRGTYSDNKGKRWAYIKSTGFCREFVYRGAGGNGNNFASEEECLEVCG